MFEVPLFGDACHDPAHHYGREISNSAARRRPLQANLMLPAIALILLVYPSFFVSLAKISIGFRHHLAGTKCPVQVVAAASNGKGAHTIEAFAAELGAITANRVNSAAARTSLLLRPVSDALLALTVSDEI